MKIHLNGADIEHRSDLTLELLQDERIELKPSPVSLTALDFPPDGKATIADGFVTLHTVGRFHFRCEHPDGARTDLRFVCVAPEVLDHIAASVRSLGHGGGDTDATKVRSVARALSTTTWFDGSRASITEGGPSRSLANFGC